MKNIPKVYKNLIDAKDDLINGKIGVIPTDTVYGLVVIASDKNAVENLCKLKKRADKPGTIIAASIDQLVELGFKRRYLKAVEQFWPNPVSIEFPVDMNLIYLHQGNYTLLARIPNDIKLLKLLEKTGPLMTSSANLAGEETVHNIEEAQKIFGNKVSFYVDGGDFSQKEPSTIIRIVDDEVVVYREGAYKINSESIIN